MIVFSGQMDKLMPVGILASGAIAMGLDVEIFLTFWGLMAFKEGAANQLPMSKEFESYGPMVQQIMQEKHVPGWLDTLKMAAEVGNVHVVACGMTMDLFGMKLEDLDPIVSEVAGVAEFIDKARDSKVTLFI